MAYFIEFVEPVLDYLENVEGLSDEERVAIIGGVTEELSRDADRFLALFPLEHESLLFRYDFLQANQQTLFTLDFVVSAWNQQMGVMQVVYVEHTTESMP